MTTTAEEWWYSTTPPTYYTGTTSGEENSYGFYFSVYRRIVTRDQSGLYVSSTISTSDEEPYWEGEVGGGGSVSFYQQDPSNGEWAASATGMGYFNVYSDGPGSKHIEYVIYISGEYAEYSFAYVDVETPEPPPANKIPETFWVNVRNADVT